MSIESIYQQLLRRNPDPGAYSTYAGWSDQDIQNAIYGSQEFANIGGGDNMLIMPSDNFQPDVYAPNQPSGPITSQGGGADLNALYQQYLGRGVDPSGAATYAGWDTQSVINALTNSQEYQNRNQTGSISSPNYSSDPLGFGQFEMDQINAINRNQTYTPGPSYGEYNFEMTGKPSDQELASNPDIANAWYRYSGTSPAPASTTPPDWLKPEDYVNSGFSAPYTQQQISSTVNPDWYRPGAGGVTYASAKGPSDLSGGEYVIDTKTGKFALDSKGNPIPVPRPNTTSSGWFNDWGVLALPLLAAGGVGALEGLGVLSGAEGAGAIGQALPYTEAFDAANLYANGITNAGQLGNILASTGLDPFLAADMGNLAAQGLSASQIAQVLGYSYTGAELAGTGIKSLLPELASAASTAAPTLAKELGTGLSTASTLAKLLAAGGSLLGGSKSPASSGYLPTALKGTVPQTTPTGGVKPVQISGGSNQSPLPGVYGEQFSPYSFGNQQPVQTPRGGNFDFMSALNKPLDTSVFGQMKNVASTNNAQNQAQNAKSNFYSSLLS